MIGDLYVFAAIKDGGKSFDKKKAENAAASLIQMMKQKTAGQRSNLKRDVPFENLERLTWELLYYAVALRLKRQREEGEMGDATRP